MITNESNNNHTLEAAVRRWSKKICPLENFANQRKTPVPETHNETPMTQFCC